MALVELRPALDNKMLPSHPITITHRKEPCVQPRLALAGICFCKNICLNV